MEIQNQLISFRLGLTCKLLLVNSFSQESNEHEREQLAGANGSDRRN